MRSYLQLVSIYLNMYFTGTRLSQDDTNAIRAHNYKVDVNLGDNSYYKLSRAFPGLRNLPSLKVLRSRINLLSGVKPIDYHCCVNSCCCFTGPFVSQTTCPYCGESRLTPSGKPRKLYQYLPLTPRLTTLYTDANTAKLLRYRHEYQSRHGSSADVFDGSHYQQLRQTHVSIDGESLGYKFFSQPTDMAIGFSTDGFGPFKRRKQTCWPIIVFLYNFPPEVRSKVSNIFCMGMIPGPSAPKDFDSFLLPFVEELLKLARGVPAFDASTDLNFILRAYLILGSGDMPAVAKILRLKGVNAIVPCRACKIVAVRNTNGGHRSHYYAALHTGADRSYEPLNLPLRTHDEFIRQALDVARADSERQKELAIQYGIHGVPILTVLSSISVPVSFPHDFMHIIENIIPMLVNHWTGSFKGLGAGSESYEFSKTAWDAIGDACAASGDTIPAAFGARVPNIATQRHHFIAETWMLFATLVGPVVLRERFTQRVYYDHFTSLVKLINLCLKLEISEKDLAEIEKGCAEWVREYERFVSFVLSLYFNTDLS